MKSKEMQAIIHRLNKSSGSNFITNPSCHYRIYFLSFPYFRYISNINLKNIIMTQIRYGIATYTLHPKKNEGKNIKQSGAKAAENKWLTYTLDEP